MWSEAATRKGIVQFKVPNDSELYHPKNRHRWSTPLFSSHEPESLAETIHRRIPNTRSEPQVQGATTCGNEHSDTAESGAKPPPEWTPSALTKLETEWLRLWKEFEHYTRVSINSLFHTLEAIHAIHLTEHRRLIQAIEQSNGHIKTLDEALEAIGNVSFIPSYPKLRACLSLHGEPLFRRTAPDGSIEQFLFKAWLCEIWDLWESHYRTQLKSTIQGLSNTIRPRQNVLGDLRHIRNNLIHRGIARRNEAASCQVLRWFTENENMQIRLRHVFDFLNQMGWLYEGSFIFLEHKGKTSSWHIYRDGKTEEPPPPLISVRPVVNPEQQDPRFRYEASVVFENGVFGRTPMGPEVEETEDQARERTRKWMTMTINEKGDLFVPDLGTVSGAQLYRTQLKGEKTPAPGIWTPSVQFRED